MAFVFGSTFRSATFGIWSHCSGVGLSPDAVVDELDAGRLLVEEHAVVLVREDEDVEPPLLEVLLVVDRQPLVLGEGARRAQAAGDREQEAGPSGHGHLARRLES
jgi:hypothetical protein